MKGIISERKFLVKDNSFINDAVKSEFIKQGYLASNKIFETRVTVINNNSYICIKTSDCSLERKQFYYNIPDNEAEELFNKCADKVYKTRYTVPGKEYGITWTVDVFHGKDLILAEIEINDNKILYFPSWLGEEVTEDEKYYNCNIAKND